MLKKQSFREIKLIFLLIGISLFQLPAVENYAQGMKINLKLSNVTLEEAIKTIEANTDFVFFFNNSTIDMDKHVNVNVEDGNISDVLDQILDSYKYRIEDNKIILLGEKAQQQKNRITGTVTDAFGPITGANVVEKGTTNGTITDMDGNFTLEIPQGATLHISYIGYLSKEIKVGNQTDYTIQLVEDSQALEEVVVVGYGVQKRSSVTGAISSVKSEDFDNRTITSAEQALQGKTAGVQITSSSAAPGSTGSVRIRGYSSNASSDPLYVVDGLRTDDISYIDPSDIESMEVLKDGASAAIYGAEAGNGVVLITTRHGKKGAAHISYDFQISSQSLGKTPEVLNATQYIDYVTTAGLISQETIDKYWDGTDTDWMDETFENSIMQKHNVNFQGGNDNGSFFASLSYLNNNGMVVGDKDKYDRISGTVNADYKIKDWLKIGTNNTFTRYHISSVDDAAVGQENGDMIFRGSLVLSALQLDPLTPISYSADNLTDVMQDYLDEGHNLLQDEDGNYYSISPYANYTNINPYTIINRSKNKKEGFVFSGSTYLDFTPIKELVITSRLGYRYTSKSTYLLTLPNVSNSDTYQDYVSINASNASTTYWQWENFVNYTKTFAEKHNVNGMIGMSFSSSSSFDVTGSILGSGTGDDVDLGITALDEDFAYFNYATGTATQTVSGGEKVKNANLSYFGRVGYDYMNKYFAQFTFRADAADLSILPLQKRWGYFPAVSAGWLVTGEKFMENVEPITYLKIRGSWGQNGSIAGLGDYMYDRVISSSITYPLISTSDTDYSYSTGSLPTSTGNYELKWETAEQWDLGFDLRMFRNRFNFSMDYYNKKTKDLIVTGASTSLIVGTTVSPINAGDVENKGFEFEVGWRDRINDFEYSVTANIATVDNEVTYLDPSVERLASGTSYSATMNYIEEGYPLWYIRGYVCESIDPETGDPVFTDLNGDGIIGEADQTMIGSAIPDFTYGITLTAAWKGLDLVVFGSGSKGNDIFIAYNRSVRLETNTLTEFYEGMWREAGDIAEYAQPGCTNYDQYLQSSKFVFDGSYFKIKQIQLGYTLPKKWLRNIYLSNLRVYCSLDDFFTFTSYPGFDPEYTLTGDAMGLDLGSYPSSKKVVFGLNITF